MLIACQLCIEEREIITGRLTAALHLVSGFWKAVLLVEDGGVGRRAGVGGVCVNAFI